MPRTLRSKSRSRLLYSQAVGSGKAVRSPDIRRPEIDRREIHTASEATHKSDRSDMFHRAARALVAWRLRTSFTALPDVTIRHELKAQCPICRSTDVVLFPLRRNVNSVHHCTACGAEFLFPQPSDEVLSSIYTSDYFLGAPNNDSVQRQSTLKRRTAQLYLDTIAPYLHVEKPQLLELGCGSGDFLLEAQSRGFVVEGLEYSQHAANVANSRLGSLAVRTGSPEADQFPPEAYDIIAASDVIEHLRDPLKALRNLYPALKKDGLLVLVTPSLDSWSRRLLGRHWMEYKTEHLVYFGRKMCRSAS
jgi:SAM-dependent methyltransferase